MAYTVLNAMRRTITLLDVVVIPPAEVHPVLWLAVMFFAIFGFVVCLSAALVTIYSYLPCIFKLVRRMAVKVRSWFRRVPERTRLNHVEQSYYAESSRIDSPLFRITAPPCMVVIAEGKSGPDVVLGCGWRHGQNLITAHHVLEAKDVGTKLYMYKPTGCQGDKIEPITFEFNPSNTQRIGTDCAILTINNWPPGVSTATLARDNCESFVSIVGPKAIGSIGRLRPSPIWGMVEYDGSTVAGFSGAPYMMGNAVAGLHVNGGKVNQGYEVSFILCQIGKDEDTAEWLEGLVRREKGVKVRRYGLDEYMVNIGGKYRILDGDTFQEMDNRGFSYEIQYDDTDDNVMYLKPKPAPPKIAVQKVQQPKQSEEQWTRSAGFSWAEEMENEEVVQETAKPPKKPKGKKVASAAQSQPRPTQPRTYKTHTRRTRERTMDEIDQKILTAVNNAMAQFVSGMALSQSPSVSKETSKVFPKATPKPAAVVSQC